MNELIHIRNKIQTRIKSMSNDKAGNYAKKMMRRCIKDIDAVIEAQEVNLEIEDVMYNPEDFPLMRTMIDEMSEEQKRANGAIASKLKQYKTESRSSIDKYKEAKSREEEIAQSEIEISRDKKRVHRFNILKKLLDSKFISIEQFLDSILDGTI